MSSFVLSRLTNTLPQSPVSVEGQTPLCGRMSQAVRQWDPRRRSPSGVCLNKIRGNPFLTDVMTIKIRKKYTLMALADAPIVAASVDESLPLATCPMCRLCPRYQGAQRLSTRSRLRPKDRGAAFILPDAGCAARHTGQQGAVCLPRNGPNPLTPTR